MHHHNQMSASNQAYWALVHLPFHIALVLLAEGGNQWVVWWRFMEAIHGAGAALETAARVGMKTLSTNTVVTSLRVTAQAMMWEYVGDPKKFESATKNLNTALESLEDIPDAFWASVHPSSDKESYETWAEAYLAITSTVMNTISDAFDISVAVEDEDDPSAYSLGAAELAATKKTLDRLQLIVRSVLHHNPSSLTVRNQISNCVNLVLIFVRKRGHRSRSPDDTSPPLEAQGMD